MQSVYSDCGSGSYVKVAYCTGSKNQQWIFNDDGTISSNLSSPNNNLCLEVNGTDPVTGTIIFIVIN